MYRLGEGGVIIRLSDKAFIPADERNVDYQQYLAWREGNEPEPYTPPTPPPPQTISKRQFFQALALTGTITKEAAKAAVKAGEIPVAFQPALDAMSEDARFAAEMLLSGATVFERNHSMTQALGAALGWTAEQIDELWLSASQL